MLTRSGIGYAALSFMWSVVEVNMTIVCACVPSLKPLVAQISPFMIFNAHEARRFRSVEASAPNESERKRDGDETPGEMIDILTRRSAGGNIESRRGARDRYPHNIKLLNLLNVRPTRMLRLNGRQSIPPNILVTTLFFLLGVTYGFSESLGLRIGIEHFSGWTVDGLSSAYWAGYVVTFLYGRFMLKRSFRTSIIWGLYIFALGSLLFWPSNILLSVPPTAISLAILGAGIGTVEMTAGLYITLCGPLEYAEIRLCVAQAFQNLGSLVSVLSSKALLKHTAPLTAAVSLQWASLAIALFNMLLAIVFWYVPVPEAPDDDLKTLAQQRSANSARLRGLFGRGVPVVYLTLAAGVLSQFFSMAGLQAHGILWTDFQMTVIPR